jgi:hypothetical protein
MTKRAKVKIHNTADELLYIETIGKYSEHTEKLPRKHMLQKYIESALKKHDWGDIDKLTAIGYAYSELAKES